MNKLKDLRNQIDTLDQAVVETLSKRMRVIRQIGTYKKERVLSPLDLRRWKQILDKRKRQAKNLGLSGELIEDIWNTIHIHALQLEYKQQYRNSIIVGIQGGKGSFNEEALEHYKYKHKLTNVDVKYLHTTEAVLEALHKGEIDMGQFATHNSVGGTVTESIYAMAEYKFKIVEHFQIVIAHALMIRSDAEFENIKTIMTHPQVLKQCQTTLHRKYPDLAKTSGKEELIDHAEVAKQLGEKRLSKNIATMGSKILAKLYGLTIVEDNLQDAKENYTSFMMVQLIT